MDKMKLIIDGSAPNCEAVKKVLEEKGLEVIIYESTFDFNDELLKQINELKAFESLYFKNPQSKKILKKQHLQDKEMIENKNQHRKVKF